MKFHWNTLLHPSQNNILQRHFCFHKAFVGRAERESVLTHYSLKMRSLVWDVWGSGWGPGPESSSKETTGYPNARAPPWLCYPWKIPWEISWDTYLDYDVQEILCLGAPHTKSYFRPFEVGSWLLPQDCASNRKVTQYLNCKGFSSKCNSWTDQ